ncbi:MAG: sensor histidine kinase [Bryobacter sp.]|nr:sensor histidine kinase [Bryobacter sp.]
MEEGFRTDERLRIARELHDTVGHHLVTLSLSLEVASRTAAAGESARAQGAIERARLVARLLLAEIRDVVGTLRQERVSSLEAALRALLGGVDHVDITLDYRLGGMEITGETSHAIYRAAQEAITNARRHGRARQVRVQLWESDRRLKFRAEDDGAGASSPQPGHGLAGMRERFEALGGELRWESAPQRGFRLEGWLPMQGTPS